MRPMTHCTFMVSNFAGSNYHKPKLSNKRLESLPHHIHVQTIRHLQRQSHWVWFSSADCPNHRHTYLHQIHRPRTPDYCWPIFQAPYIYAYILYDHIRAIQHVVLWLFDALHSNWSKKKNKSHYYHRQINTKQSYGWSHCRTGKSCKIISL